jgi:SNF2 family DNA or RNA helicase
MELPKFIPVELHHLITSQSLKQDDLQKFGLTVILRAAFYYTLSGDCFLKRKLLKWWNVNSLPIAGYLIDEHTHAEIECNLYPHQIEVLNFMREREDASLDDLCGIKGGIIAITMGLGKTLIAISYSIMTPSIPNSLGFIPPTLIVTTKTLMSEWKIHGFEKFFGQRVSVLYMHPDYTPKSFYKKITERQISEFDFVVTTYDVCKASYEGLRHLENLDYIEHTTEEGELSSLGIFLLHTLEWERVFCDESQIFANDNTKLNKSVMGLKARRGKWCLSGTVIRNCMKDFWSQLVFCGFNHPKAQTSDQFLKNHDDILNYHPILSKGVCRMTNESVSFELPTRHDITDTLDLPKCMKYLYECITEETIVTVRHIQTGSCRSTATSVALLSKLRQLLIAPHLLHPISKRKNSYATSNHTVIKHLLEEYGEWLADRDGKAGILSPKIRYVTDMIRSMEIGDKILIFSMFTSALDLASYAAEKICGYARCVGNNILDDDQNYYVQIDGSVIGPNRSYAIEMFKTKNNVKVMFLNFRVGSEGLNLTMSNKIIFLDGCWTPSITEQAASRAHRVGQKKEVYVYRPIMDTEVERNMIKICKRKETLISEIMNKDIKKSEIVSTIRFSTLAEIFGLIKIK